MSSLELVKEFKLELPNEYEYGNIGRIDYNIENKQLLVSIGITNLTSNSQTKSTGTNIFSGVFVFTNEGKYLGKVGKFNSFDEDGLVDVFDLKYIDNKIQIFDFAIKAEKIFDNKKPFKYLYKVIRGKDYYMPGMIYKNKAFSTQAKETKRDKKDPGFIDIDAFKRVFIADLTYTDNPKIKTITNVKKISSYKKYFNQFWGDKKLLKNRRIKRYLKRKKNFSSVNYSLFSIPVIGPPIAINYISFANNNTFYTINGYGTEIKKYNLNGDSLDVYPIKKFEDIRSKEIEEYKNIILKKFKMRTNLSKFHKKYSLSLAGELLYNNKTNNITIKYFLRDIFQNIAHIPKSNAYLLVYSLDKRKVISDFIPIDFIPVKIDAENKLLIGVKEKGKDFYLQFYKWEY